MWLTTGFQVEAATPRQAEEVAVERLSARLQLFPPMTYDAVEVVRPAASTADTVDLRLFVDGALDFAMIFLDPDRRIVRWNKGAENLTGWTETEAVGKSGDIIFTAEDREAGVPQQEMETALRDGRAEDERWHVRKDGSLFWGSGVMSPLYAPVPQGTRQLRGFAKVFRDLTERKQAQDALQASQNQVAASENRLRQAFAIETVGVLFFSTDGRVTECNDTFLRQIGYTRDDLENGLVRWDTMTPSEYMPELLRAVDEFLQEGRTTPYTKEYIRKDGSRWWGLFAATRVNDDEGVEFAVDITEQKRTEMELRSSEAALRKSEARFRTLSDAVPQMIWTNTAEGQASYFNHRWYEYTGLSYPESAGPGWQAIAHPEDAPLSVARWQQALAEGMVFDTEYRLRRHDGVYRWFIGRNVPLKDEDGRVTGWFGTATDIQELRELRDDLEARVTKRTKQLREVSRRLVTNVEEERRRLSRELHDQTGQHLAALGMEIAAIERDAAAAAAAAADAAAADAALAVVRESAPRLARVKTVTEALSRDIHRIAVDLRPTSLDDLGLVASLKAHVEEWEERAQVIAKMESVGLEESGALARRLPPEVEITVYRIVQEALTNVAKHAAGATRVDITLQRGGGHVLATIEDDGSGFDVETTGAGRLGFAGMRERAAQLGGTLEVESDPGSGTTIYARLPVN